MTQTGAERAFSKTFRLVSPRYSVSSIRMGIRVERTQSKGNVIMENLLIYDFPK